MTVYQIEHKCPQCGAPATLEETDRLFACPFCRVNSYLLGKGFFQYVLPHNAPDGAQLLYFPYWRCRGSVFTCFGEETEHRVVDASLRAADVPMFPVSVGLRSQSQKLRFLSGKMKGRFIRPEFSLGQVKDLFEERFAGHSRRKVIHQALVGEALSLIYSPYYHHEDRLHDAIVNRPVAWDKTAPDAIESLEYDTPESVIRFVAALCPHCGWDLQGDRASLVLVCRNCGKGWAAGRTALEKMPFVHFPGRKGDLAYLPFWRIRAEVSGIDLATYADLIRVANLPKVPRPEWEETDFFFWTPAFKLPPGAFLRIGTTLTMNQPLEREVPQAPKGRIYSVTLPVSEAVESLKTVLAGFFKPRRNLTRVLPGIEIRGRRYMLVYIPFDEGRPDLTHPTYQVAVNKNMLALAESL